MPKTNKNKNKSKNKLKNKSKNSNNSNKTVNESELELESSDSEISVCISASEAETEVEAKLLPLVSICTPTFNRRPFIPFIKKCIELQTYPKSRIEWIIIDDGTDPIGDLVADIEYVKYFYYPEKMLLGKKRNLMHKKCSGDIIVYMDDDDYYPKDRVSHAVDTLLQNPNFLVAGSSEMHIYFDSRNTVYQCGPYKDYHATAATFAFRKELLLETSYNEDNALAEERHFLKNYTIPLKQLDTQKSIMVFSHKHNSLNKEKLLENMDATKTKLSRFTVDDFIDDAGLKQFYMVDMNNLLTNYEPGKPEYKPKLMEQIKKMENERNKRLDDHNKMLEAQKRMLFNQRPEFNTNTNTNTNTHTNTNVYYERQIANYEKQIEDKVCLINELLKKIKDLNAELNQYKTSNV
jgi:glycosyltransferase involved in cell wall biosynthesis